MRLRKVYAGIVLAGLIAAACGGSEPDAAPPESTTAPAPSDDQVDDPQAGSTADWIPADPDGDYPVAAAAEGDIWTVAAADEPVADDDRPPTYGELRSLAEQGEISPVDVALLGLSLFFDGVVGVPDLEVATGAAADGADPPVLTSVLATLDAHTDELTDQQQEQVLAAKKLLDENAVVVYETDGFDTAAFAWDSVGDAGLSFKRTGATDGVPLDPGDAARIARQAAEYLRVQLGGGELIYSLRVIPDSLDGNLGVMYPARTRPIESCVIFIAGDASPDLAGYASTIAHEMFHCWDLVVSGGIDGPQWLVEGLAEWAGEEFANGTSAGAGHAWPMVTADSYQLFESAYSAVGFYWEIDHLLGPGIQLWDLVGELARMNSSGPAFRRVTNGLSPSQIATLATMPARTPSLGAEFTFDGRSVPDGFRSGHQHFNDASGAYEAGAGEQTLVSAEWNPGVDAVVLQVVTDGQVVMRWRDGATAFLLGVQKPQWCSDGSCLCPDGEDLFPTAKPVPGGNLAMHALFGLAGSADAASSLSWELIDVAERCAQRDAGTASPGEATNPGGFEGVWRANNAAVTRSFNRAFDGAELEIEAATGDVLMTLLGDGSALLEYVDVSLIPVPSEASFGVDSISILGGGTISWAVRDGRLEFGGGSDFAMTAAVENAAIGSIPITITDEDVGGFGTTTFAFTMSADELALSDAQGSRGDVYFPSLWTRID